MTTFDKRHFLSHSEIVNQLSRDNRFKSICKGIAKRPHMADELYQEFFLSLCEITDSRLLEAKAGGYLDVLCVGIIHNVWSRRLRVKHNLYEATENSIPIVQKDISEEFEYMPKSGFITEHHLADPSPEYDFDQDQKIQRAEEFIKDLVETEKDSRDPSERFRARVFDYSRNKYKNVRQFAKASGIPYAVCLEANKTFKEKIKCHLSS